MGHLVVSGTSTHIASRKQSCGRTGNSASTLGRCSGNKLKPACSARRRQFSATITSGSRLFLLDHRLSEQREGTALDTPPLRALKPWPKQSTGRQTVEVTKGSLRKQTSLPDTNLELVVTAALGFLHSETEVAAPAPQRPGRQHLQVSPKWRNMRSLDRRRPHPLPSGSGSCTRR